MFFCFACHGIGYSIDKLIDIITLIRKNMKRRSKELKEEEKEKNLRNK